MRLTEPTESQTAKRIALIDSQVDIIQINENLIEKAYMNAKTTPGWNDEDYQKSRMAERISMLKGFLPNFSH